MPDTQQVKKILYNILIAMLVVVVGLIIVNQWLEFRYKSVFLQQPCVVCADLNPYQTDCIKECFNPGIKEREKEFTNQLSKTLPTNFSFPTTG